MQLSKETINQYLARGGKITICPPQKFVIKRICKSKTSYNCGRIRMQYNQNYGNGSYSIEKA